MLRKCYHVMPAHVFLAFQKMMAQPVISPRIMSACFCRQKTPFKLDYNLTIAKNDDPCIACNGVEGRHVIIYNPPKFRRCRLVAGMSPPTLQC